MNKREFQTLLRWLGKRVKAKHLDTPEAFFKESMVWEYKAVNDWQLTNCLKLYYTKGIVPSFVERSARFLYGAFIV